MGHEGWNHTLLLALCTFWGRGISSTFSLRANKLCAAHCTAAVRAACG